MKRNIIFSLVFVSLVFAFGCTANEDIIYYDDPSIATLTIMGGENLHTIATQGEPRGDFGGDGFQVRVGNRSVSALLKQVPIDHTNGNIAFVDADFLEGGRSLQFRESDCTYENPLCLNYASLPTEKSGDKLYIGVRDLDQEDEVHTFFVTQSPLSLEKSDGSFMTLSLKKLTEMEVQISEILEQGKVIWCDESQDVEGCPFIQMDDGRQIFFERTPISYYQLDPMYSDTILIEQSDIYQNTIQKPLMATAFGCGLGDEYCYVFEASFRELKVNGIDYYNSYYSSIILIKE